MKKFVWSIVAFAVPSVGLLALISIARYASLEPMCSQMFHVRPEQKILILGDSHAQCDFLEKPDFGIKMLVYHSTQMNISLIRLKELERRGGLSGIKLCVLNFCQTTIREWNEEELLESSWRMMPYALRHCEWIFVDRHRVYLNLMRKMLVSPHDLPPLAADPSWRIDGASFADRPADWRRKNVEGELGRHFGEFKAMKDSRKLQLQTLREINNVCTRHGIKLVLYSAPLTKEYYEGIPDWAKANMEWWKVVVKDMGIPYYDYMQRCGPDMFADCDHLLKSGAERFTDLFYCEVLKPLLEDR